MSSSRFNGMGLGSCCGLVGKSRALRGSMPSGRAHPTIDDRAPFVSNVLAAKAFNARRLLNQLWKPVDRAQWFMTPQPTVGWLRFKVPPTPGFPPTFCPFSGRGKTHTVHFFCSFFSEFFCSLFAVFFCCGKTVFAASLQYDLDRKVRFFKISRRGIILLNIFVIVFCVLHCKFVGSFCGSMLLLDGEVRRMRKVE